MVFTIYRNIRIDPDHLEFVRELQDGVCKISAARTVFKLNTTYEINQSLRGPLRCINVQVCSIKIHLGRRLYSPIKLM